MDQPHTQPAQILLIEDDPHDARLFIERLKHFAPGEYSVTQARTLAAALEEAADTSYRLAVIDLTLPDSAGLSTCSRFQASHPEIPYVVLTGVTGGALPETLARAGAKAALVKDDCSGPELVSAMRTAQGLTTEDRVSREAAQASAGARFRNAVIDTADGIIVLDGAGKIVLVSQGAESLLGKSTAELIGTELGIDMCPGQPVRVQVVYEEEGLSAVHEQHGAVRHFDVCRLHLNELELWPFAHHWAGKPVTVCALRDVSGQVSDEQRQRDIIRIGEPVYAPVSFQDACADAAVGLGRLTRFNRFEVSAGTPGIPGFKIVFELGVEARGREVSAVTSPSPSPAEFASWTYAQSSPATGPQVCVAVGHVRPEQYGPRDEAALARCAESLALTLARMRTSPVFATAPQLIERNIQGMTAALHEAA